MNPNGEIMSANSIPTLTLRGHNSSKRVEICAQGERKGPESETGEWMSTSTHDRIVQGTDGDAAMSRLSAVALGYMDDPFAQYFVEPAGGTPPRRLPIINRGKPVLMHLVVMGT